MAGLRWNRHFPEYSEEQHASSPDFNGLS